MKSHITVGTIQDDQYLIDTYLSAGKIIWPVPKDSEIGDLVYLLIPSLTGCIIARGCISTTPVKSINWKSKYESTLEKISFSVDQPCIEDISDNIPEWEYLKYARSYTTIPEEYVAKFQTFVGEFDGKPRLYREIIEEEVLDAINNKLFTDTELKLLSYFLTAPNNTLNAIQLATLMGYPRFNSVNLIIGSIGRKFSDKYMIHPDWWSREEPNWWSVIAYGEKRDYFHWTLKPQVYTALKKANLFNDKGFVYENDEIVNVENAGNEEGKRISVLVNIYERDATNRKLCIKYHGSRCAICGFDFEKVYGEIGKGYIQVHHIVPLNEIQGILNVNPKNDLIPLCANCHAVIHRKKPAYTLLEVKSELDKNIEEAIHGHK